MELLFLADIKKTWPLLHAYLQRMDLESMASLPLSVLLPFLLLSSLNIHLSSAVDTVSLSQPLTGNQTIVSKGGNFELGFFSPGNSLKHYVGIWYKKIPTQTIIWVANREAPISNISSAKLTIYGDGNLVLLSNPKTPVWSSNSTSIDANSAIAVLLDTGNLVLRNESDPSNEIWQSFAHPTDTWMPNGWLGVDKITGEYQSLTSWKDADDPAPGYFGQSMDHDGSDQYVLLWNGSEIYWTSGLWTGQYFSNVPGTKEQTVFNFTFVDNNQRKYATYTITVSSVITRFVVGPSGLGKQWMWMENSQKWSPIFTQPLDQCDVYSLCGAFGICDSKSSSFCSCSDGFKPVSVEEWDKGDWNSGCKRKTQLQCGRSSSNGGEQDGFIELQNMQLPANPQSLMVSTDRECETACLNNCSCNAYAYNNGCSIWTKNIRNLRQLYDGDNGATTLYLRLAATDLPSSSTSHRKVVVIAVSVAGVILLLLFCIVVGVLCARQQRSRRRTSQQTEGSLISYRYADLQQMTKNFSDKLGSGGFGSVFKGIMPDSTVIAVKKLEGLTQGEKQFRTEVSTLGTVQHVNLVHLLGFCFHRSERLLVYEYMPGGSLNSQLFGTNSKVLDWRARYQIVIGTARGLAYLHEQCRECIIHCDVKPDNILLDDECRPKVADFGMAKLIGREFSHVLTTMRGTIGYLAPEWISGLPITPKVDVYSFGMMVLEVISGRRNTEHFKDESQVFFPLWAAKQVVEGSTLSILDPRLEGIAHVEELTRVCKVACWCIQDNENHRPSMGQVVQLLEGGLAVDTPPIPMALQHLKAEKSPVFYHSESDEDRKALVSSFSNHDSSRILSKVPSLSSSFDKQ